MRSQGGIVHADVGLLTAPLGAAVRRPMRGRSIDEPHRGATQLELLFDLTIVIAVAAVTQQFARDIAEGSAVDGVRPFLQVFFAIWWAWMNFTWFASSYDTDDVPYRLLTFLQMAGVVVIAVGVPPAFNSGNFRAVTVGYLVMRVGLVAQWLRLAIEDPSSRPTARRFALGIAVAEVGWVLRLVLDESGVLPARSVLPIFLALVGFELAIPWWAERNRPTYWHPHHIAERYGLFVIILIGESVLAASNGIEGAFSQNGVDATLVTTAIAGLILLLSLWWLYFLDRCGEALAKRRDRSFRWGYGHYWIFVSLAAIGAGLEATVHPASDSHTSGVVAGYAVAIPVSIFILLTHVINGPSVPARHRRPAPTFGSAAVILLLPPATAVVPTAAVIAAIAAVATLLVASSVVLNARCHRRERAPGPPPMRVMRLRCDRPLRKPVTSSGGP
jgi:low temperature requirement protein LtrA